MTSQDRDKHLPALAPGPGGHRRPSSTRLLPGPRKISLACLPCKQAKRKVSYRHIRRVSGKQYPSQAFNQGTEDKITTKGPSPKRQLGN